MFFFVRPSRVTRATDPVSSAGVLAGSLAALAVTGLVFTVWPALDLAVAARFWTPAGFVGDTAWGRGLRCLFEAVPFIVLAGMTALYAVRQMGGVRVWAPNGAGILMMVASLALGPGLLVNTILKEHSHRPRPVQVAAFGGPDEFRPFYRFDGACARNCSFVSGEGASAFWTIAPALLVPTPLRAMALVAAVAFGAAASLLRIAFGGHFLSDSLFAGLFVWLVVLGCWAGARRLCGTPPGSTRG